MRNDKTIHSMKGNKKIRGSVAGGGVKNYLRLALTKVCLMVIVTPNIAYMSLTARVGLVCLAVIAGCTAPGRAASHPPVTTVATVNSMASAPGHTWWAEQGITLLHVGQGSSGSSQWNLASIGSQLWSPRDNGLASFLQNFRDLNQTLTDPNYPISLSGLAGYHHGADSLVWVFNDAPAGTAQVQMPSRLGVLWQDSPSLAFPTSDMLPMSAMSYANGDMLRGSVFGLSRDGSILRELWYANEQWNLYDHANPPGVARMAMGPGSVTRTPSSDNDAGDAFVFVRDEDTNEIWVQSTLQNRGWEPWVNLGDPLCPSYFPCLSAWHGTPVALSWLENDNPRVHIFVPVGSPFFGGVRLFHRFVDRDSSGNYYNWSSWVDDGAPAGVNAFDITQGIAWNKDGALRVNVFGVTPSSDPDPADRSRCGGKVVNFAWDGSQWIWRTPADRPTPYCTRFQTMSAVAINTPQLTKLSLVGEDRFGTPWEYTSSDGEDWHWRRPYFALDGISPNTNRAPVGAEVEIWGSEIGVYNFNVGGIIVPFTLDAGSRNTVARLRVPQLAPRDYPIYSGGQGGANAVLTTVSSPLSAAPSAIQIDVSQSAIVTITLPNPAPPTGVTLNLSSDIAGVVRMPETIAIPSGVASYNVSVTGMGAGRGTITITGIGYDATQLSFSVQVPPPPPNFSLVIDQGVPVLEWGTTQTYRVRVQSINGFTGQVQLQPVDLHAYNLTAIFDATIITPNTPTRLSIPTTLGSTRLGPITLYVQGCADIPGVGRTCRMSNMPAFRVGRKTGNFVEKNMFGYTPSMCGSASVRVGGGGQSRVFTFTGPNGRQATVQRASYYEFSPSCRAAVVMTTTSQGTPALVFVNLGLTGYPVGPSGAPFSILPGSDYYFSLDESLLLVVGPVETGRTLTIVNLLTFNAVTVGSAGTNRVTGVNLESTDTADHMDITLIDSVTL